MKKQTVKNVFISLKMAKNIDSVISAYWNKK